MTVTDGSRLEYYLHGEDAHDSAPSIPAGTAFGGGVLSPGGAARLAGLLGLDDDELLVVLDADPLSVVSGDLEHRPELRILLDLLTDAEERAGEAVLRRWVRAAGPRGRPLDALLRRDFPAFEDALGTLAERGFVLRGGG